MALRAAHVPSRLRSRPFEITSRRRRKPGPAVFAACETLEPRRLLSSGPATPTLTATSLDHDSIELTYSISDGSRLQLETKGPGDLNFSIDNRFDLDESPGMHVLQIDELEFGKTYDFRVRADKNGAVAHATASTEPGATLSAPFGLQKFDDYDPMNVYVTNFGWDWDTDPTSGDPPPDGRGVYASGYSFDFRVKSEGNEYGFVPGGIVGDVTETWWWAQWEPVPPPPAGSYLGYCWFSWPGSYAVQVRVLGAGGAFSEWSEPIDFPVEGARIPAATNVTATAIGGGYVQVGWDWDGGNEWVLDYFEVLGIDAGGNTVGVELSDFDHSVIVEADPDIIAYYVVTGGYPTQGESIYSWSDDSPLALNPQHSSYAAPDAPAKGLFRDQWDCAPALGQCVG